MSETIPKLHEDLLMWVGSLFFAAHVERKKEGHLRIAVPAPAFYKEDRLRVKGIALTQCAHVSVPYDAIKKCHRSQHGAHCRLYADPSRAWHHEEIGTIPESRIPESWTLPSPGEPFIFTKGEPFARIYQCARKIKHSEPSGCWSIPSLGDDAYGSEDVVSLRWWPHCVNKHTFNIMMKIHPDVRSALLKNTANSLREKHLAQIQNAKKKMGYVEFLEDMIR